MRKRTKLQADNLLQGISEQTPALQTLNHQKDRVNILPDPVYGNVRRPQSFTLGTLDASITEDNGWHFYVRDETERYLIVSDANQIFVYDCLTGAQHTVNAPDGWTYLDCTGTPRNKHRFLTGGDYTFVINRDVTVVASDVTSAPGQVSWLIHCKQGDYAVTYSIVVDGTELASFKTSDSDVNQTATGYIMRSLGAQMADGSYTEDLLVDGTYPVAGGVYSMNISGSVIELSRTDGTPMTVTVKDDLGNTSMIAVQDEIQDFEDLPARAPDGFLLKVGGDSRSQYDDYYVQFRADDPTRADSAGVWVETLAPDTQYALDAATLPHVLVREEDGTFTFRMADWEERKVGGLLSSPWPGFVGKRIENGFFYADRLGFLSRSGVILSVTRDYFNFFRKTARQTVDTDPVDVTAQTAEALTLRYAFPFDESLVVLADRGQLALRGGTSFTPDNASLKPVSHYEMDADSSPAVAGSSLFFTTTDGLGTAVLEMQVVAGSDRTYAVPVSDHVPSLLPNDASSISASSTRKALIIVPHDGGNNLFMYHWLWSGKERVMSSWSRVTFGDPREDSRVYWGVMDNSIGYLVVNVQGSILLLRMDLDDNGLWEDTTEDLHLDFVWTGDQLLTVHDQALETTSVTMPFPMQFPQVLKNTPTGPVDLASDITDITGTTISLRGLHDDLIVGSTPEAWMVFSQPYPQRMGSRGEMMANVVDRYQISRIALTYSDSGPFKVIVTRENRDPLISQSWGQRFNDEAPELGEIPVNSGVHSAAVKGSSDEVTVKVQADRFYPLNLVAAEWSGILINKRK